MRTRQIHKDFWPSESAAELDHFSRLLFMGLWCAADREGLILNRPRQIAVQVFPYDGIKPKRIEDSLDKMRVLKMIDVLIAENGDGTTCLHIRNFKDYQSIHKNEAASKLICRYITGNVDTLQGITGSYTSTSASTSASASASTSTETREREFPSEAHKAAKLLAQLMVENDGKAKLPDTEKAKHRWLGAIDKLNRLDGRSWAEIDRVIRWSQANDFWKSNILSGDKLRAQFAKMMLQMERPAGTVTDHNLKFAEDYLNRVD